MITVLRAYVPCVSLERVAQDLLESEWVEGTFIKDVLDAQGATEIVFHPWVDVAENGNARKRQASFRFPLPPAPMCPSSTRVTNTYRVSHKSGAKKQSLLIESSSESHDVPYGDYFQVQEQISLEDEGDGVQVTKSFALDFAKRTIFRSTIESGAKAGQKESCDILLDVLRKYATLRGRSESMLTDGDIDRSSTLDEIEGGDNFDEEDYRCVGYKEYQDDISEDCSVAQEHYLFDETEAVDSADTERGGSKCITAASENSTSDSSPVIRVRADGSEELFMEVIELQRRTTLFHDDWRAPFLPHDGNKRWRWVDQTYNVHRFLDVPRRVCVSAVEPPVSSPPGWRFDASGWSVDRTRGPVDEDGWQYAPDFYTSDIPWRSSARLAHCRRRRWRCQCTRATTDARTTSVEMWELQRRTTLVHSDWRAPFLPHDGKKRRRWLDVKYNKHPWSSGNRGTSALCDTPDIVPPSGWRCVDPGWHVVEAPGPADEDGWQYAVDFTTPNNYWGKSPSGLHCRRRLWKCEFLESID